MAKEIIWTESALIDRFTIYQFWLHHNQSAAYSQKLENIFQESSILISHFPEIGILTDFPEVRVKSISKYYKIFYRNLSEKIEIIQVWDTRQDPEQFKIT